MTSRCRCRHTRFAFFAKRAYAPRLAAVRRRCAHRAQLWAALSTAGCVVRSIRTKARSRDGCLDEDRALGRRGYPRTGRRRALPAERGGGNTSTTEQSTVEARMASPYEGRSMYGRPGRRQMAGFGGGTQYATEFRGRMLVLLVAILCLAALVLLQLPLC